MHYDEKTKPPHASLKDGDTYQHSTFPNADHYTFMNGNWRQTKYIPVCQYGGMLEALKSQLYGKGDQSVSAAAEEKLPPMTCSEGCGFTNEYVGKEHLINGIYVCRQCRPRYERRQRTLALKAQNEASSANPFAYGPSWKDGVGGL